MREKTAYFETQKSRMIRPSIEAVPSATWCTKLGVTPATSRKEVNLRKVEEERRRRL